MPQRRIFTPSLGPSSWRAFLADPFVHWRREKSAWELAVSWEAAAQTQAGFPECVHSALSKSPVFTSTELILAVPEHRVTLDDDRRPSQSDLWLVVWTPNGYASVTVEAKAGEEFDKPIEQWLEKESDGKKARLAFLTNTLGLAAEPPGFIRYQLLHRAAAAVLEAKRCRFKLALMLVQSFQESRTSWSDYEKFAELLSVPSARNAITGLRRISDVDLYLGWVDSPKAKDSAAANAI